MYKITEFQDIHSNINMIQSDCKWNKRSQTEAHIQTVLSKIASSPLEHRRLSSFSSALIIKTGVEKHLPLREQDESRWTDSDTI